MMIHVNPIQISYKIHHKVLFIFKAALHNVFYSSDRLMLVSSEAIKQDQYSLKQYQTNLSLQCINTIIRMRLVAVGKFCILQHDITATSITVLMHSDSICSMETASIKCSTSTSTDIVVSDKVLIIRSRL